MRYPVEEAAAKHKWIVKEASRLFRERGFENVSVGDVMKAAGLTHGAFYAHFGSKEELQAAAVAYGTKVSLERMQRRSSNKSKESFADQYLSRWHRDNPGDGCTMAALAQELARSTPELKAAFEHGLENILSAKHGDRKGAIFLFAAMIGAWYWLAPYGIPGFRTKCLGVSDKSSADLAARESERSGRRTCDLESNQVRGWSATRK